MEPKGPAEGKDTKDMEEHRYRSCYFSSSLSMHLHNNIIEKVLCACGIYGNVCAVSCAHVIRGTLDVRVCQALQEKTGWMDTGSVCANTFLDMK